MWFIRVFVRHEQGIQMSILILYIISFYLNNISGALCDSYKRTEQHPSDNIIYTDLNKQSEITLQSEILYRVKSH